MADKIIATYVVDRGGMFTVYNWIESLYGVREGLRSNQFLDNFDSLEVAKKEFPDAEIWPEKGYVDPMPINPPSWFDPAACGERWDDDY